MRRAHRSGLAAVALLWLVSCRRELPPQPPPIPLEQEELDAAFQSIAHQEKALKRYQGFVRVRGRGPEGSFDARLVLIFERPDRLRVELLGAFGSTRWSAVADAAGIVAYFPGDEHYVKEQSVPEVVKALLGLELTAEDVMALLSGTGVSVSGSGREPLAGVRRGNSMELELEDGSAIVVDPDGQVTRASTATYRVVYDTRWKRGRRQFPDALTVDNGTLRVTIQAEDVDANTALAPDAFVLEIPDDAQRLRPAEVEGQAVFVLTREPPF